MTPRPYILAVFLSALALGACGSDDGQNVTLAAATTADQKTNGEAQDHDDHHDSDHAGHGEDGHDDHDEEDHADHGDDDHSDDESHDHGTEESSDHVELTPAEAADVGILVSRAQRAPMQQSVALPAEIRFDADRVASVSPKVSGRIIRLFATEGDTVTRGATLAVLSSRELADLKAEYLTAATAEDLARQALTREETLFADRITSEADLQAARAELAAARANLSGVENKLHAVGVSHGELENLADAQDGTLANVRVSAPIGGVIARRTATLGATVSADDPSVPALFTIVDDGVLWADIAVYKQNTGSVLPGARVILKSETGGALVEGEIATVLPSIDETSRTATARMIVDNSDNRMRPGQFATAEIVTGSGELRLQVPSAAVVTVEGRASVFVPTGDGFAPRAVSTGADAAGRVVILSGLREGDEYVSDGAFTLKAQLEKDAFGDDHDH